MLSSFRARHGRAGGSGHRANRVSFHCMARAPFRKGLLVQRTSGKRLECLCQIGLGCIDTTAI